MKPDYPCEVTAAILEALDLVRPGKFATIKAIEKHFGVKRHPRCPHCKLLKPVSQYRPNPKRSTGHDGYCRECARLVSLAHGEAYRAAKRRLRRKAAAA